MLEVRVALSRLGRWITSISLWMNRELSFRTRRPAPVAHTYTHFDAYSRPRQVQLRRRLLRGRAHPEEAPGSVCIRVLDRVGGDRRGRPAVAGELGRHPRQVRESLSRRPQRRVRPLGALGPHRQDAVPAAHARDRSAAVHRCLCCLRAARAGAAGATPWVYPLAGGRAQLLAEARHRIDERAAVEQIVFHGLESSPFSSASSAWRHTTNAAAAQPSPTACSEPWPWSTATEGYALLQLHALDSGRDVQRRTAEARASAG
jgi:hypothetical protein